MSRFDMTGAGLGGGKGQTRRQQVFAKGNNIRRRVCPFFFHVAQSFRMKRSEMRNLFSDDNELITKLVIGTAGRNLLRPFRAIYHTSVIDDFRLKYNSLLYYKFHKNRTNFKSILCGSSGCCGKARMANSTVPAFCSGIRHS